MSEAEGEVYVQGNMNREVSEVGNKTRKACKGKKKK